MYRVCIYAGMNSRSKAVIAGSALHSSSTSLICLGQAVQATDQTVIRMPVFRSGGSVRLFLGRLRPPTWAFKSSISSTSLAISIAPAAVGVDGCRLDVLL